MKLPWSVLHKLEVMTESGVTLGYIHGITVDTQTHQVLQYEVNPKFPVGFFRKPLLISFDQVISMNLEAMVVDDNVSRSPVEQVRA